VPFFANNRILTLTLLLGVGCVMMVVMTARWRAFQTKTIARERNFQQLTPNLPQLERKGGYVSSNRCRSCHPSEHASWHRSYHRTMTQIALPENVAGAFDGTTVLSDGLKYRVTREDDQFWAEMPDPEIMMYVVQGPSQGLSKKIGPMTYLVKKSKDKKIEKLDLRDIPLKRRQVVMTTGSHHYQTYWVEGSDKFGRLLQTLPLIYLLKDQRWIPREAAFMRPAQGDHFITQWNNHCIKCHSTGGVPGLVAATNEFETRVGELGIACEACHGPGERHIQANQDPLRRFELYLSGNPDSTIVNPSRLDHEASSQVCGQCHGVFIEREEYGMRYAFEGILYRPGDNLLKTRYYIQHPNNDPNSERKQELRDNPEFFRQRWWEDGTILAGGREFTAMSVSACYKQGEISCLSCHSMHDGPPEDQLEPGMDSVAACTQCHDQAKYTTDIQRHTFHLPESSGSNCLNCHMPRTSYALFDAIRSHQIAAPNLAGSVQYGVPNGCNLCHLDQTLDWTQEHLADWYGYEKLPLNEKQKTTSAAVLWLLSGDAAQRVIAAWHFGWEPAQQVSGTNWLAPLLSRLLADPYGVVRYVAEHSLRKLSGFANFRYDFLAAEEELQRQAQFATQQWRQNRSQPAERTGGSVCIDENGDVLETQVEQLLLQRNNRPVTIKE
jgi:predicted CXXCH cytochrome family protein